MFICCYMFKKKIFLFKKYTWLLFDFRIYKDFYTFTFKFISTNLIHKLIKQITRITRTSACFWMELYGSERFGDVTNSFIGSIINIYKIFFPTVWHNLIIQSVT